MDIVRQGASDGVYIVSHALRIYSSRASSSWVLFPNTFHDGFDFYALPPMLVTSAMFLLTAYKCVVILCMEKSAVVMRIITLFLQEGIVWFTVVLFFYITEMVIWAKRRSTQTQTLVIPSIACNPCLLIMIQLPSNESPELDEEEEVERLLPPIKSGGGWRTLA
ncbi:hypothetical protein DFH07DRAFT_944370 [Mycena maculata]|uniref:Uncharacterized protein n=1 Tax=Mycena maculata TaxID=230809 RepID=A0AAD7I7J1_9AGAR|nr:hypothetical protein DFH07DRAFT_944370 [Mycena maculata]